MPVIAPNWESGGWADNQSGGGYDPKLATAGGYDPNAQNAYLTSYNSIGGQAAVTAEYNGAPNWSAGGWADNGPGTGGWDSEEARKKTSGLPEGGGVSANPAGPATVNFTPAGSGTSAMSSSSNDWRVRVALNDGSKIFYKDTSNQLMAPLASTNGVIFPYTPTVNVTHTAMYNSVPLTHSNYAQQFYQGSEVQEISISGDFTVQDASEGQYLLAAIYFFRAATKMFFGFDKQTGMGAGNPPPIVYLHGYGDYYFPGVPCVVTSFNHTLPNEVDYVEIPITETTTTLVETRKTAVAPVQGVDARTTSITGPNGEVFAPNFNATVVNQEALAARQAAASTTSYSYNTSSTSRTTRLPSASTLSISLRPVYSRRGLHERFNLEDFAAGKLINGSGSFL